MGQPDNKPAKSFWETLPGIITAIAALLVAIGGILQIRPVSDFLFPPKQSPAMAVSAQEAERPLEATATTAPTNTQVVEIKTEPPVATVITETATSIPAPTTPTASAGSFITCEGLCDGTNIKSSFPGGKTNTIIFAQFKYENFPSGADYSRTWSLNGKEWIKYQCKWDGPSSGTEDFILKEPEGFDSGDWVATVSVDGVVVLTGHVNVTGDWKVWKPAGTKDNTCHSALK